MGHDSSALLFLIIGYVRTRLDHRLLFLIIGYVSLELVLFNKIHQLFIMHLENSGYDICLCGYKVSYDSPCLERWRGRLSATFKYIKMPGMKLNTIL